VNNPQRFSGSLLRDGKQSGGFFWKYIYQETKRLFFIPKINHKVYICSRYARKRRIIKE